jgi:HEAT repeat protein
MPAVLAPLSWRGRRGRNLDISVISNVRKEAAAALGEIANPSARPLLEPYSDDPDPDVRKLVRWALQTIA